MIITSRERDLGGFSVRRLLPYATHRMVGPFIFFDHIGPARFPSGKGLDVRPHPHINLATVTYLFEGKIHHRDSLGSDQLIEPGAINWMTAGHGIVHSERSPDDLRQTGSTLSGIQCWVALPNEYEEIPPSFTHYPKDVLPEFELQGITFQLLLGEILNHKSPVRVHSDMFYLYAQFPQNTSVTIPVHDREAAVYVLEGKVRINDEIVDHCSMYVEAYHRQDLIIEALEPSKLMFLGGKPVGERFIYWNFVASSEEKIEKAKMDWVGGPGDSNSRFPKIPGDDQEFIPLPEDAHPKGTIM